MTCWSHPPLPAHHMLHAKRRHTKLVDNHVRSHAHKEIQWPLRLNVLQLLHEGMQSSSELYILSAPPDVHLATVTSITLSQEIQR